MKLVKKNNFKFNIILLFSIISILTITVIYFFSFLNYSKDMRNPILQEKIYGFFGEEKHEDGFIYNWMSDYESLLRIRYLSPKIEIPVFCYKQDINNEPINLKIYINNKLIYDNNIPDNKIRNLIIDLEKLEIKKNINKIIDIKFKIDKLWNPGGEDKRMLGIAVGEIVFLD